jgi:DHA1 family inner membrane transport protein
MLQQIAFFGMFGYLAAYLMQRDHLLAKDLAFPLVLAGAGVVLGGYLGGRVADHPRRVTWLIGSWWSSGVLVAMVFTMSVSLWVTVTLACGMAVLSRIGFAVTPMLLLEMAGHSRTTATGLFATSNQLGICGRWGACWPPGTSASISGRACAGWGEMSRLMTVATSKRRKTPRMRGKCARGRICCTAIAIMHLLSSSPRDSFIAECSLLH